MTETDSDQRIGGRYDRLAKKYNESRFGGPFGEFHAYNMLRLIDRLLPDDLEPRTALDVAAGTGVAALYLAQKGHWVTAIDLSEPPPLKADNIDAAFIQAIVQNDQSIVLSDYEDGLKSAALSIAASDSAKLGQPVTPWRG